MDNTPNLTLPYIMAAQAQKHVTHNEAIRALDAIVQLSVLDRDLAIAPASPSDGDRYIVATGATGDWNGKDGQIAAFQDNGWMFHTPLEGWLAWVADEDKLLAWNGTAWGEISGGGSVNPTPLVGVNATADTTNRLSVSSSNTLLNNDGSSHRLKINKHATQDTASSLYQTNFSGRAEMGLTGDDDFHFKVSPDGSNWLEAFKIDKDTGSVTFPNSSVGSRSSCPSGSGLLINGAFNVNQRGFSGGYLPSGEYGYDRWKADTSGCTHSLSGETLTLTSGTLVQIVEALMWGQLDGQSVILSIEDLAGGDLLVEIAGVTETITAGAGRNGVSIAVPDGATGDIGVKLSPASGAVTFRRVKLEIGDSASIWAPRSLTKEITLCQRYFSSDFPVTLEPKDNILQHDYAGFAPGSTVIDSDWFLFPEQMRTAPTMTFYSPSTTSGQSPVDGKWSWFNSGVGWIVSSSTASILSHSNGFQVRLSVSGADVAGAYIIAGAWSADAEL